MPAGPTFRLPPTVPKEYTRPLIVASFAADPMVAVPPDKFSTVTFPVTLLIVVWPAVIVILLDAASMFSMPLDTFTSPPEAVFIAK